MGQSTDGILFYGYCWDEEGAELWADGQENEDGESEDAEERYARLIGIPRPTAEYPERDNHTPEAERARSAFSDYWDAKGKAVEASGVEVDRHCSGECPIPYVAVTASKTTARRGYPETIKTLDVGVGWDKMLADYCALMGITPPQEKPGWWLVSMWS